MSTKNLKKKKFRFHVELFFIEITFIDNEDKTIAELDEKSLFCIPIFWNLIQDEAPVSPNIADLALAALIENLNIKWCHKYKPQYLYLALQNIKRVIIPSNTHILE
jgi:hypothetical protein